MVLISVRSPARFSGMVDAKSWLAGSSSFTPKDTVLVNEVTKCRPAGFLERSALRQSVGQQVRRQGVLVHGTRLIASVSHGEVQSGQRIGHGEGSEEDGSTK